METCIKTGVLTSCCCAYSSEEGFIEDVKRDCCCAGSGKGVMEDVKRDKCVHKVDGHMHKSKITYSLLLCR